MCRQAPSLLSSIYQQWQRDTLESEGHPIPITVVLFLLFVNAFSQRSGALDIDSDAYLGQVHQSTKRVLKPSIAENQFISTITMLMLL
jgi:hypothetical protein